MPSREKELRDLPPGRDPPGGRLHPALERLVAPFRRAAAPPAQIPTSFYTDTTVCIGCKACEVACKQWNQLPADGFHWSGNSYDNTGELSATSWRHVKFVEQIGGRLSLPLLPSDPLATHHSPHTTSSSRWLMMSDVCKHCLAAPCQQACPTGALIHNEFENVYIQPDICNGCSYCVAACPFGVITRATWDGHAHKCTLCYDRQKDGLVPACAKACPTQSIQFGPVDELRARARRRVDELHRLGVSGAYLYGDKPTSTYSELRSFYILIDHPSVYGLPENPFNPWLRMKGDYLRALLSGLAAIGVLLAVLFLQGH